MTVGVAYSRTPAGRAAIAVAAREAAERGTELAVLAVVDTAEHAGDDTELGRLRTEVAAAMSDAGAAPDLRWRLVAGATRGVIAETLLDLAEAERADPLVLGTKRRSPVGKLILGSTVQRVLLDAPMPVLVVKP